MSCEVSSIDYGILVSTINAYIHSSMKWLKNRLCHFECLAITLVLGYSITDFYQDETPNG